MWRPGRNTNHISRGKSPPDAALDCAIAFFMRAYGLSIYQRTANHQGCRAGLYEEDVNLGFVPLRRAIGFPVDQHGAVVGKVRQQLHRKVVRIDGGIRMHFIFESL